jgi:hypothetical protein
VEPWQLPACIDGPSHAVERGHCWRCGLIVKPKRPPRATRARRRRSLRARSLPDQLQRLVDHYGFELVESVLYEHAPLDR